MFKNYLLVALRNLKKNKSYVIINTLGLGISLACCVAAYMFLAFNIEFNSFHDGQNTDRTFAVHTLAHEKDGRSVRDDQAPTIMAPLAAAEIAGIERYTRWVQGGGSMVYEDKAFNEGIAFADSSFLDMFEFPLSAGRSSSFKDRNSIFITEELAKKYFGDEEALGRHLVISFVNDHKVDVLVAGVFKKFPLNNSFAFNALMRIEHFLDYNGIKPDDWGDWRSPATFFQLAQPGNAPQVGKQLSRYLSPRNQARTDAIVDGFELVPFKTNYTQAQIRSSWTMHPLEPAPLVVFSSLAVMILLIACFNLTNTTIAMTAKRLKEVGVRKAVGAARQQIVAQFIFETTFTIVMSLAAGLLMAQFIVPAFMSMWEFPFGFSDISGVNLLISLVMLVFIASLLAGVYPALFSSKFKPTALLKGTAKVGGTNMLTRILVSAQFAISVIVLIAGVIFVLNTKYQEQIRVGYDRDMVLMVSIQGEREFDAMEAAIKGHPKIQNVAVSDGNVGGNNYTTPIKIDTATHETQAMGIGKNYMETLGLRIAEGRTFNLDNASDQDGAVIVNRAFVARTGLKEPIESVIYLHGRKRIIVGVVENHIDNFFRSKEAEPFVFYPCGKNQYFNLLVRAETADLPEVKTFLEKTWKETFPIRPFESQYQEEVVMKEIRNVNGNLKNMFLFITVLGGLLSVSGIFALASLNIAKRTKEIGIRKALGASVRNIVTLLNREFAIILVAAAIVGSIGGYYLTTALLEEIYEYYLPVGLLPIALCALAVFAMGIVTTSSTIFRAARANPVETLRTE